MNRCLKSTRTQSLTSLINDHTFQMAILSVIVTEEGSMLLCCWRHWLKITLNRMTIELQASRECETILTSVAQAGAAPCDDVRHDTLTRKDLPPVDVNLPPSHAKCDNVSRHVFRVTSEATVQCRWNPSHFDFGQNVVKDYISFENGIINRRVCHKLIEDCKVRQFKTYTSWIF